MHADQRELRMLCEAILAAEGDCHDTVLAPWLREHVVDRTWLASVAARPQRAWRPTVEDLWRLYAMSRVNELLLRRFQPPPIEADDGPALVLSLDGYVAFMTAMVMRVAERAAFHPFFHEIVGVEPADDAAAPVAITATRWPCLMLGDLLFSRAGVVVRAGRDHLDPEIATRSTLYWAYRRAHRPVRDLSHGWGGNSQWRTAFRRDCLDGAELCFNLDGTCDLAAGDVRGPDDDTALTIDERIELLTHRCFVRTAKPHDDLWPFDDKLSVVDGAPCAKHLKPREKAPRRS